MRDHRNARMRELTYRLVRMAPPAPPFPEEPMTQLTPTRSQGPRRPVLWAAAAAVVVVAAIGIPALLSSRGADPVVGDTTTMPVETTQAPVTTTEPTAQTTTTAEPTMETTTTSAPTTTAPAVALIDIGGLDWVRTDSEQMQIVGSDDQVVMDHPTPMTGAKSVAWDGNDGLVVLGGAGDVRNGDLRWVTPGEDRPVDIDWLADDEGMIVDVVTLDGRPVVVLRSFAGELGWYDLETGEQVDGDPALVDYFEELGVQLGAQGRTVVIEYPENADADRDETGALLWPFDLPELVVSSSDGEELARIEVGSEMQPWASLHDFDGRRVVVAVEPHEPAFAPRTFYVIDLECADCTEVVETPGGDTVELVGIEESAGPVVATDLG